MSLMGVGVIVRPHRLSSDWLQTGKMQLGLHWFSMVPFTPILESEASLKPVGCNFNLV